MFHLVAPFDKVETCISIKQAEDYVSPAVCIGWGSKVNAWDLTDSPGKWLIWLNITVIVDELSKYTNIK